MAKKYRALEKLEWPNEKGGWTVVNPGDEFDEPPESTNIKELVKAKAVELASEKKD